MPVLPGAEPFAHEGGPIGAVLCHGFTGNPTSMRPWAQYLAAEGLSVIAPRLPGHGTSWPELNKTRWPDWYAELERAFVTLRSRCTTVFAAGLSMGATLTLRLAEQHPPASDQPVDGIICVNASLTTERKDAKLLPLLSKVVPSIKGVGGDVKKPGVAESAYPRTPLKAAYSLQQLWRLTRADLGRVTQPALIFRSRVDHVVEPISGRILLEQIGSSDVAERVLEDSFHVATLDNDAPRIFAESLGWMRARARAGEPA